jgi:hypothetical protein
VPEGAAVRTVTVALVSGLLLPIAARPAAADPFSIVLHSSNAGITAIQSTVSGAGETPDGRQLFNVVIHEEWESLAPGVLTFSNFPERSILDVTKLAFNHGDAAWTSLANRTRTDDQNVPPFGILFEAVEDGFFTNQAGWRLTPAQLERCQQQFPTVCNQPFYGNLFTFYNGQALPGATVRIRFALQLDRGEFTLAQTPNAVVPEPSTMILFGTAALIGWSARRKKNGAPSDVSGTTSRR